MKRLMKSKNSVMKIQTSSWITNHSPLSQTLNTILGILQWIWFKDNEVPSNLGKTKFGLEHHHEDDIKFCKGVIQKQDQTLKMDST